MNTWQRDIFDFHKCMGISISDFPCEPDAKTKPLRVTLIREETEELLDAIEAGDMEKIADGAVDSIVVILGTMVSYGIDLAPIWDEIHRTNMAKQGGGVREDGKILKPVGWKPPDVANLLKEQGWKGYEGK